MQIICSSIEEKDVLGRLDSEYQKYSEMGVYEKEYLNSLVLRYKPRKVLEIGVSSGASSVIILNALMHNNNNAKLYSIDFLNYYYKEPEKKVGFLIDNYKELKDNHKLYSGGLAYNFIEEIGNEIDFCFIDTAHIMPSEILDFITVLPFLSQNAVVVFHDIALSRIDSNIERSKNCIAPNIAISAIAGEKLLPDYSRTNIGGVIVDSNIKDHIWEIFNALALPWSGLYWSYKEYFSEIRNFIEKHYPKEYVTLFDWIIEVETKKAEWAAEKGWKNEFLINVGKEFCDIKYKFYRVTSNLALGKLRKQLKQKKYEYKKIINS